MGIGCEGWYICGMEQKSPNLLMVFLIVFILSALAVFAVYHFFDFNVALLLSLCWLAAVISTVGTGVENVIINESKSDNPSSGT